MSQDTILHIKACSDTNKKSKEQSTGDNRGSEKMPTTSDRICKECGEAASKDQLYNLEIKLLETRKLLNSLLPFVPDKYAQEIRRMVPQEDNGESMNKCLSRDQGQATTIILSDENTQSRSNALTCESPIDRSQFQSSSMQNTLECIGCRENLLNQLAHCDPATGCLRTREDECDLLAALDSLALDF